MSFKQAGKPFVRHLRVDPVELICLILLGISCTQ